VPVYTHTLNPPEIPSGTAFGSQGVHGRHARFGGPVGSQTEPPTPYHPHPHHDNRALCVCTDRRKTRMTHHMHSAVLLWYVLADSDSIVSETNVWGARNAGSPTMDPDPTPTPNKPPKKQRVKFNRLVLEARKHEGLLAPSLPAEYSNIRTHTRRHRRIDCLLTRSRPTHISATNQWGDALAAYTTACDIYKQEKLTTKISTLQRRVRPACPRPLDCLCTDDRPS
jgi:hypothetical protein